MLNGNGMKLYLIRHGESENNALWSSTGTTKGRVPDPELTETGHKQAQLLADHLADSQGEPLHHPWVAGENGRRGFALTHVYCSLMTRSILTAQYVSRSCNLPLLADADIFEKCGIYEETVDETKAGLPGPDREYFEKRFPKLKLPAVLGHGGWYNRPYETEVKFLQRSIQVALDLRRRHENTDDCVAMVIHGDLIDQLINEVTGAGRHPENYANYWDANWVFHNTSLTRIDFISGSRVVVYTNRLQHLPPELVTW
jgi:2,3-bisphosphoglycerate-dependent phosphoglycerate mutase